MREGKHERRNKKKEVGEQGIHEIGRMRAGEGV